MAETIDLEKLVRRIAEPLLEDERLRGDLDDAAFQPLLDWALAAAERCAARAARSPNALGQIEVCSGQLRRLLRLASRAAGDGRREELLAAVAPPAFGEGEVKAVMRALSTACVSGTPEDNAAILARALSCYA